MYVSCWNTLILWTLMDNIHNLDSIENAVLQTEGHNL